MPDADLLRIQELPADEYRGGSGEMRKFHLEFLGKTPSQPFPYTIANEVVSSHIGNVLGFNIPVVLPHRIDGEPLALVLWMKPAARQQEGPPLTSRALKEFVESHDEEIHGAIILDLYLGNSDRSFGPERRNIAVDETGRLLLFDFGNSLFYRQREHVGIEAGIPRLDAVEQDLRNMFDKQEKNPQNYYFQLLRNWGLVEKWCQRLEQLPDYVIESAVQRVPSDIEPPNNAERIRLVDFLKKRRHDLLSQIRSNTDLFPGLAKGGQS